MSRKLLVADDSIIIQKTVETVLSGKDFLIDVISDGTEAVNTIKENIPDVVLVDTDLPGMNGYELCRAVKKDSSLKNVQVFLLVAAVKGIDKEMAKEVCADDYIVKPFEPEELLGKLETARASRDIITQMRNELQLLRNRLEKAEEKNEKLNRELAGRSDSINVLEDEVSQLSGKLNEIKENAEKTTGELIEKALLRSIPEITDNIIREIIQGPLIEEMKSTVEKAAESRIPYTVERVVTGEIEKLKKQIKDKN